VLLRRLAAAEDVLVREWAETMLEHGQPAGSADRPAAGGGVNGD
jgi:hypothetical protein